ncbi:MAG: hypothetical protein NC341_13830 [Blautia sp.]|nr:hypothetical protein [Blautia sp.]MCM1202493.1 hypothetical protein [Bacteroides fragilis]
MLRKPVLAHREDRRKAAQINPLCGDPEGWFDSVFFREKGLYAASFDFFVNWEKESVCDEVWIKRISDSEEIQQMEEDELTKLISDCDGIEKSRSLYFFLRYHGMREKYMLFRDVPESLWSSGQEKVVELDLTKYRKGSISYLNAEEIQDRIEKLRIKPASLGKDGLRYATSYLEGYLSEKPFFWPGDVDTILYDRNNRVAAVIEFKKYTADSTISFERQGIHNYRKKDYQKYKSLALLRDRFQTGLFVIYYPVPGNIDYIIVEELEGTPTWKTPSLLHAVSRTELALPLINRPDRMREFAGEFMDRVIGENQEKENAGSYENGKH